VPVFSWIGSAEGLVSVKNCNTSARRVPLDSAITQQISSVNEGVCDPLEGVCDPLNGLVFVHSAQLRLRCFKATRGAVRRRRLTSIKSNFSSSLRPRLFDRHDTPVSRARTLDSAMSRPPVRQCS